MDDTRNPVADALQMDGLSEGEQEEALSALGDLVMRESMARLVEGMDGQTAADFEALLAKDPLDEEVAAFLAERVPGADKAVRDAVDQIRSDILDIDLADKP